MPNPWHPLKVITDNLDEVAATQAMATHFDDAIAGTVLGLLLAEAVEKVRRSEKFETLIQTPTPD